MTVAITDDIGRIPMSPFLKATLVRAADYAASQMHREVTLEHLLLALAEDPEASVVLKSSEVDINRLMSDVSSYIGRIDDRVEGDVPPAAAISADLRRILEASAAAASQGRRREINGAIVLAAIVGDAKSPAAHMLRSQGLTFEQAIRALQQAANSAAAPPPPRKQAPPELGTPPAPADQQAKAIAPRAGTSDDISASAREREMSRPAPPAPAPAADPGPPPPAAKALPEGRASEEFRQPAAPRPPAPVDPIAGRMAQANIDRAAARPAPPPAPQNPVAAPAPAAPPEPFAPPPQSTWAPAQFPPPEPAPAPRMPFPPANGMRPPVSGPAPLPPFPPATQGPSGAPPIPGTQQRMPFPPQPGGPPPAGGLGMPPVNRPAPPQHAPWSDQGQPRGPHYDDAMARLDARRPQPPLGQAPAPSRSRGGTSPSIVQAGQLVENIPRKMRAFVPVIVEARIARAEVKAISDGLQGGGAVYRHEVTATSAMSVRLRAPDGGFTIETASPETQWIENVLGLTSNDYASWRWSVCPQEHGKKRLQLIISARTVGADGLTAETALPDQIIDVAVGVNVTRTLGRWLTCGVAAVAGGLLSHFSDTIFEFGKIFLNRQ